MGIKEKLSNVLDFLFPNFTCLTCDGEINVSKHKHICDDCSENFTWANPSRIDGRSVLSKDDKEIPIRYIYSPFLYSDILRKAILKLKYGNDGLVATTFAPYMANCLDNEVYDVIIPVPLSKNRQRERGFNQATLLAKEIGKLLNLPVIDNAIARIKNTTPQVKMSHKERQENQKGSYKIIDENKIKGMNILLVDDVLTTGATTNEIATILKEANAKIVSTITIARVSHNNEEGYDT